MGNLISIDVGIVVIRCAIFDRHNDLCPAKIFEKDFPNVMTKGGYLIKHLSFYSPDYSGTFHFLQFNVNYYEHFLKSDTFKGLITFFMKYISSPEIFKTLQSINTTIKLRF